MFKKFPALSGCDVSVMVLWRHPVDVSSHDRQHFMCFMVFISFSIILNSSRAAWHSFKTRKKKKLKTNEEVMLKPLLELPSVTVGYFV